MTAEIQPCWVLLKSGLHIVSLCPSMPNTQHSGDALQPGGTQPGEKKVMGDTSSPEKSLLTILIVQPHRPGFLITRLWSCRRNCLVGYDILRTFPPQGVLICDADFSQSQFKLTSYITLRKPDILPPTRCCYQMPQEADGAWETKTMFPEL